MTVLSVEGYASRHLVSRRTRKVAVAVDVLRGVVVPERLHGHDSTDVGER